MELFSKIQADVGSWLGTKNALYYCAQSANSFSWVLFMSLYTTPIVLPHLPGSFTKPVRARETFIFYFPNQKWQNYRWVEKTFGDAISRSNSICPEKILFLTHHNILWIIGSLRCSSDDKVKEAIAWQGKKKTLHVHHTFLYISLPSTARLLVKMPNQSHFMKDVNKQMTKFILFMNLNEYGW